jgi:hypothetical protein
MVSLETCTFQSFVQVQKLPLFLNLFSYRNIKLISNSLSFQVFIPVLLVWKQRREIQSLNFWKLETHPDKQSGRFEMNYRARHK